jgi:cell wall-associated NlpC family hydrolase
MMKEQTQIDFFAHAIADFPRESCGLVAIINGVERYLPCRNVADRPEREFVLSPEDFAKAEDIGEVVAITHSHPNMLELRVSEADKVQCEAWGLPWHMVNVFIPDGETDPIVGDVLTCEPSGYVAPLLGRKFSHGVLDCYALIRDYYKMERGIDLPNYHRQDNWWEKGQNLYLDNFRDAGFVPVDPSTIAVGDIILMQIRSKVPNHAGVYIGDGIMLHHLVNRLSCRELYDGYFQENTRMILRYAK